MEERSSVWWERIEKFSLVRYYPSEQKIFISFNEFLIGFLLNGITSRSIFVVYNGADFF